MTTKSIEAHFEDTLKEADAFICAFPWEDKRAYAGWLAQQYFLVRHTTRLIALAISKCEDSRVRDEYIGHLAGERGHDELLLKDLRALGFNIADFTPFASTRLMIHNQYYWMNDVAADSLFGYAQYLEGISIFTVPKVIERLKASGETALSFLQLHADSDEDHYPEGLERIRRIGANAEALILPNLAESHLLYGQIFADIESTLTASRVQPAA